MTWAVSTRVCLESCKGLVEIFTMDQRKEQRVCITLCANLGKRDTETLWMIQRGFGTKAWVVHRCINVIPGSRPVAHQLTTKNTQVDHKKHNSRNCCTNSRAHQSGSSSDNSRHSWGGGSLLWDMPVGSHGKIVQAHYRNQICAQYPDRWPGATARTSALIIIRSPVMSRAITVDESWVYGYGPEKKRQSAQCNSPTAPRPIKARQVKIHLRNMIISFLDIKGNVHKKIVPTCRTVNSGNYCEVLRKWREKVRRYRPQLWRQQNWLLHHENRTELDASEWQQDRTGCITLTTEQTRMLQHDKRTNLAEWPWQQNRTGCFTMTTEQLAASLWQKNKPSCITMTTEQTWLLHHENTTNLAASPWQ